MQGGMPLPVIWHIYPTNRCQNNCYFCIMKDERKSRAELSSDTLSKAIRDAARYHAKTVQFVGGGEPLLHPHIKGAIKLAKSLGLKVALSTNGILLDKEIMSMVDFPRISLDAVDRKQYKDMKGNDAYDGIIKNIQSIPEGDRKKLGLGFVINRMNYENVYEFGQLGYHLGVGFVHIRPEFTRDAEENELLQTHREVFRKTADLSKDMFGDKVGIYLSMEKFDGYWTPRCYDKCRATPLIAVLKANARFIPCQDRIDLEFGDYNKQPFVSTWGQKQHIWGSDEHRKILDSIKLEECPRCVETKKNELIQKLFVEDGFVRDML